jgi:CDP-6-deoxy-D-xylo-4-hexulose-3-dehydrase
MVNKPFLPGQTYIPVSGKVFDREEIENATAAAEDGWWTEGRFAKQFESEFRKFLGVEYVTLVNSGSSANLNAFCNLHHRYSGKRLKAGDEYITTQSISYYC